LFTIFGISYTQEKIVENTQYNIKEKSSDQGWYWQNGFLGRWNPFGALFLTKLYYRHALHREKGTFWFDNSAIEVGIEQELSAMSRTSLFLFWQPLIALNMTAKLTFEHDFIGYAKMNGPNDDYNIMFPPFTGLNPFTKRPEIQKFSNFIFEFSPQFTFGGAIESGAIALIYRPSIFYFHSIGYGANNFYYNNREAIILKGRDVFFRHDIKLGYSILGTGLSIAAVSLIEHVLSSDNLLRVGVFGAFSYEKSLKSKPNFIPYARMMVGTWVVEKFLYQHFAIQIDAGIKWKFK
ncbi:MAG: hypothetical protein ACRCTJ_00195, partial [Brevinema sp.]